jgi:mannosyltransferase
MSSSARRRRLFLDSTIFDLQPDGGISRYWYELVSNIAVRHPDWNLTLFADPHTKNKFGRRLIEITNGRNNVRIHEYVPSQAGRYFGPRLRDDYQGFVWHSSYYRVPRRLRIPEVCTVQDFIYERYFSGTMAWLHMHKKRRAILGARQIICPSEATKRELLSLYPHIDESRCHVIYHGLSKPFGLTAAEQRESQTAQPQPYALFVGSRAEYKNFRLAVLSVELIPDLQLFVIGGKKISGDEIALLNSHLPGRFKIFEAPADETLRDLYRSAAALAYPSRCEGFGFPPLEAMACGCPVVAMGASSIPEVVGDAGMLLSSENPMTVAEALRAVRVPEHRRALVARGLQRAGRFSWDRTADETVAAYERAIL